MLLERPARQRFSADDHPIFPTSAGTPMHAGNFAPREWEPALKAAGLEGRFR